MSGIGRLLYSYIDLFKVLGGGRKALNLLRYGVCDGCSLGTRGIRDWTHKGIHLCWIRLNLLRINTLKPIKPGLLGDVERLRGLSPIELTFLGRIPTPLIRRRGWRGFKPIKWGEAIDIISEWIKSSDPRRIAFYSTSRGTVNETYYILQKVARLIGTNNIDYSARICHSPSTRALGEMVGYAASTCSYRDILKTDLVILFGSHISNSQPMFMKYFHIAKRNGVKIIAVNPFIEDDLVKYRVPSIPESALLGTRMVDLYIQVYPGGDIAFISGVLKYLIKHGWIDDGFIERHTVGWDRLVGVLDGLDMGELERFSGVDRGLMYRFARIYGSVDRAVFIWSMGVTMHSFGVDNVRAIINLALSRGMVGREYTGLMPIRGHSGVQGGAEVGVAPDKLPGGLGLDSGNISMISRLWGFKIPESRGYYITEVIEKAYEGEIDILYMVGGNIYESLPDRRFVYKALRRIPLRVHHDITLNTMMLIEPGDTVILLPATTRYEMDGGYTETTTERRIIYGVRIMDKAVGDAMEEWRALCEIARRIRPEHSNKFNYRDTRDIRREIAEVIPLYRGIEKLRFNGESIQWGGRILCRGYRFGTPDGRAVFKPVKPPHMYIPGDKYLLIPRRGRQFNTMILSNLDTSTFKSRVDAIISRGDAARMDIGEGEEVLVRSSAGRMRARIRIGDTMPRTIVMYWPECNRLIKFSGIDPESGMPPYRDCIVSIEPV